MSTTRQAQVDAILKRISFGAVPIGGFYWLDPKVVAEAQRQKVAAAKAVPTQEIQHELSSL
jgi:hypothetical protein